MDSSASAPCVTQFLRQARLGDQDAAEQLMAAVYDHLHRLAAQCLGSERVGHTLQATALVHEAWIRLAQVNVDWHDRVHFYAVASRMMRRIMVDYARAETSQKRGGRAQMVNLNESLVLAPGRLESLLILNDALERLGERDRRRHDIAELMLFGGLTLEETGAALKLSAGTVHRELKLARAWLQRELTANDSARP